MLVGFGLKSLFFKLYKRLQIVIIVTMLEIFVKLLVF